MALLNQVQAILVIKCAVCIILFSDILHILRHSKDRGLFKNTMEGYSKTR